jgi:hypothetical protein
MSVEIKVVADRFGVVLPYFILSESSVGHL